MSQARLYVTEKSRKEWTCGKCHEVIPKGSKVIHFTVGYRGVERHRCGKTSCFPLPSERESSAVSSVLAAIESTDFDSAGSYEDIEGMIASISDAIREVAEEYSYNEMFDVNEDLQERVQTLEAAADDLEQWESSVDPEPDEADYNTSEDSDSEEFSEAYSEWLNDLREAAKDAVEGLELP